MKFQLIIFLTFLLNLSTVSYAGMVFPDVYDSEPLSQELSYLVDKGVVEGYPDGTFKSLNLINRAEFTKMIIEGLTSLELDEDIYNHCFEDQLKMKLYFLKKFFLNLKYQFSYLSKVNSIISSFNCMNIIYLLFF